MSLYLVLGIVANGVSFRLVWMAVTAELTELPVEKTPDWLITNMRYHVNTKTRLTARLRVQLHFHSSLSIIFYFTPTIF